ncbi:hypothetical protein [Kitasatospora azatica]|uniref:hypothetical protein n=1 Tax=Kitasatospora azatica TaxID=58347 RepID=UPI000561D2FF|nr:hypothetical protein [Kitasatospora azatica]
MLLPTTANLVELIEVVRIADPVGWYAWTDTVPGETIGLWEDAQQVLAQLEALPPGTKMRCFTPRFALRAHTGQHPDFPNQVLFEIAFCFQCEDAWFFGPAVTRESARQTFDPDSPPARELLRRFRAEDA